MDGNWCLNASMYYGSKFQHWMAISNDELYYGSKGRQINIGYIKIIGQTGFHMLHNKYTFYY